MSESIHDKVMRGFAAAGLGVGLRASNDNNQAKELMTKASEAILLAELGVVAGYDAEWAQGQCWLERRLQA